LFNSRLSSIVAWGTHTPVDNVDIRQNHKASTGNDVPANNVFSVIAIRDPTAWAVSMCQNEYAMEWEHTNIKEIPDVEQQHCPNLVPNNIDYNHDESLLHKASSIPVTIHYAKFDRTNDSLIDHWNDYYMEYHQQKQFPLVLVRFEDLVFHPKQVIQTVCECAGGAMK
jgi:predicted PolB exonuclease-like 3'-5' exonuclease